MAKFNKSMLKWIIPAVILLLIGGGLMALVVLILRRDKQRADAGAPITPDESESPISPRWRLRGFFTPLMTSFIVITIVEMILLWSLALSYSS